ncbi:AMP-binding protein [Oscillospiraceae bacterium HV4-5-C5C]|nr:AMP-binding protein [Oscillospiraceae bacterium HV4-5-C5C]
MKTQYKEPRFDNFRQLLRYAARRYARRPAFKLTVPPVNRANVSKTAQAKANTQSRQLTISYRQLETAYDRLCTFMLNAGLQGRRIAISGRNSYEWTLAYLAAATVGVAVPLDRDLAVADQNDFLLAADCSVLCTDRPQQAQEWSAAAPSGQLRLIVPFKELGLLGQGRPYRIGPWCASEPAPADPVRVNAIPLPADQLQVLIFTSGTTGHSKGVCLSQANICADIHSTISVVRVTPTDHTLSVLPLHHTYECTLNCLLLLSRGACISYLSTLSRLSQDLQATRPSLLVVVPELLQFLSRRIQKTLQQSVPQRYRGSFASLSLAEALRRLPWPLRLICRYKVRQALGGRLRLFIVGAAKLEPALVRDFLALGIRTLQGYGLTECAPLVAGNHDFYLNPASTGVAIPGIEMKIDRPDSQGVGQILTRGANVMLGYFEDPDATRAAFKDGWFCTGDLGRLGPDGELYITGRQKNVIVTDNGKNIYPEELETRLGQCPEIGEVLVLAGQQRSRVCVRAKILPDLDWIKQQLGHLPTLEEAREAVERAVAAVNDRLPTYKRVQMIEILTEALQKTTTRKIRRCGDNLA